MDATGQSAKEIRYVCVARRTDNAVVAQRVHVTTRTSNYLQNVKRVLDSPGWASITTDKLTLDDGDNTFYVLIDDAGRTFIAVASKAYPSRHIYDSTDGRTEGFLGVLQRDFTAKFGDVSLQCQPDELTNRAKLLLKDLCDRFNDLTSIDKLAKVKAQVDGVASVMQDNIRLALQRGDRVEELADKVTALNDQAGHFEKSATTLKRNMRCRNWKMTALIAAVILIVLAILIAIIANAVKGKK